MTPQELGAVPTKLRHKLWAAAYLAGIRQSHLAQWWKVTTPLVARAITPFIPEPARQALNLERRHWSKRDTGIAWTHGQAALLTLTLREIEHASLLTLTARIKFLAQQSAAAQWRAEQAEQEETERWVQANSMPPPERDVPHPSPPDDTYKQQAAALLATVSPEQRAAAQARLEADRQRAAEPPKEPVQPTKTRKPRRSRAQQIMDAEIEASIQRREEAERVARDPASPNGSGSASGGSETPGGSGVGTAGVRGSNRPED